MKKYFLVCFLLIGVCTIRAQKRLIDNTVFGEWPSIQPMVAINSSGSCILYTIEKTPPKSRTLVIQSTNNKWKLEFIGAREPFFFDNGNKVIFKKGADSVQIIDLNKRITRFITGIKSYKVFRFGNQEGVALKKVDNELLQIIGIENAKVHEFKNVYDYTCDNSGANLVLLEKETVNGRSIKHLLWTNIVSGASRIIWSSDGQLDISRIRFDNAGKQVAFMVVNHERGKAHFSIWYFNKEMSTSEEKVTSSNEGMPEGCQMSEFRFSSDGNRLLIDLRKSVEVVKRIELAKVDIWNYMDDKIQSQQLNELDWLIEYKASFNLKDENLVLLKKEDERLFEGDSDDLMLLTTTRCYNQENYWRSSCRQPLYLVNAQDGKRTIIKDNMIFSERNGISPDCNYVLFYDYEEQAYFSYNIHTGSTVNITNKIPFSISDKQNARAGLPHPYSELPDNWLPGDEGVIIYDQYDIWQVDPAGIKQPICLTQGYGRKNAIILRLLKSGCVISESNALLIGFRPLDKANGFYQLKVRKPGAPELLHLDHYLYYWPYLDMAGNPTPLKAAKANIWLVQRMTASESPNLYVTKDGFKSFQQLTYVEPQKNYNWLTAELHQWPMFDGRESQGILYKPENFNPNKKYPVIFHFYEEKSDELNNFLQPDATGSKINIPYFVSNGFLVFVPDVHYTIGETAESVCNSVCSAARYLSNYSWVDSSRMALQGHSFGGYEVNALISKNNIFAAAAEVSGVSDIVSAYDNIQDAGFSKQFHGETSQYRIGTTIWQRPDLYIKNSPVFYADNVTTPLLMCNNKNDKTVTFDQGIEFFTALRRLNKRVWMLQYDDEGHQLSDKEAKDDYTIRLTQFFNHYLKNAPAPVWMTQGIPAKLKGIITGYDYDPANNCGKDCKVCKQWNEKFKKDSAACWREISEKTKTEYWIGDGNN